MVYIVGLFVIMGLIIGGFTGSLPFSLGDFNVYGTMSSKLASLKDKTYNSLFPKSENEILLNDLDSNYSLLDRFFSESSESSRD